MSDEKTGEKLSEKIDATTLEGSPNFKEVAVPHASDVKDPSEISLHLLVKNGANVVGRLIDNIGPYVDEVVAVLNDCDDETEMVLATHCALQNVELVCVRVSRSTHPELYILDTKKTYQIGRSLGGEEFGGPFTEEPILADWSATRNLGWNACTRKWRLFLDCDDVVQDPEGIPGLVKLLEEQGVELACSPYHFSVDSQGRARGKSMRERLAVNKTSIRWVNPIHEVLVGTMRVAHLQTNLVVRDMRDNDGKDVRVPGRNFKILYHRARTRDWDVSPRILADLIMEVRHMAGVPGMIDFADDLLAKYMEDASWPEERGYVLAMVGEMHEGLEHLNVAIEHYNESLEIHPGAKTAFRLCRALFKKACELKEACESWREAKDAEIGNDEHANHDVGKQAMDELEVKQKELEAAWRSVIEAHKLGVANKVVHQVLDDGPLFEEMEKIHVAGAFMELGDLAGAKSFVDEAVAAFPENSALKQMKVQVDAITP